MNRPRYYPYLVTGLIMAVFFGITTILLPRFNILDPLDLGRASLILSAIQFTMTLLIIALMKRDQTYRLLEERGIYFGRLFRPILAWLFIALKFAAVFLVISFFPEDVLQVNPSGLLTATVFALSIGLFEEFLFRGFLFKNLLIGRDERAVMTAALISSILFGLFHIDFMMVSKGQLIGAQLGLAWFAFGMGFYFAAVVYRYQKLWIPIVLHALVDVSTFYLIALIETDALFDMLAPVLSVTDLGGTGSNSFLLAVGLVFLLFGFRMLRQTFSIRQSERLLREANGQESPDLEPSDVDDDTPQSASDPFDRA